MNYLSKKIHETYELLTYLRDSANEDTQKGKDKLAEIKEAKSPEDEKTLTGEFRYIQFFNNLKLSEVDKTARMFVELVKIAVLEGSEGELTSEELELFNSIKNIYTPLFIVNKFSLQLVNEELEKIVKDEIQSPSKDPNKVIDKIIKKD